MSDKFFKTLVNEGTFEDWVRVLDWLFSPERFSEEAGWNQAKTSRFTKRVHKEIEGLGKNEKNLGEITPEELKSLCEEKKDPPYYKFSKGDGIGKSLVRHIRNGIAHGQTNISRPRGEPVIQILDYSSNKRDKPTAFIVLKLSDIVRICDIYSEIEKGTSKKDKKREKVRNQKNEI